MLENDKISTEFKLDSHEAKENKHPHPQLKRSNAFREESEKARHNHVLPIALRKTLFVFKHLHLLLFYLVLKNGLK